MTDVQDVQNAERGANTLAELCESLVVSWRQIGQQAGAGAPPDAPVSLEAKEVRRSLTDRPKNIEYAAGQMSGELVGAISLLLQAVATQLRARPLVSLTIWPLVRAELEYAGRVAWLLEPLEGSEAGPRRVARALLEQLSSLQREKYTASRHSKSLEKQRRREREALLASIKSLFPDDVHTPLESPEQIVEWKIEGEPMLPLGKAIDLFISLNFTSNKANKAMYDTLSDYSHPSVMALARQSVAEESEGVTFRSYPPDDEVLEYQVKLGCVILYKAAYTIAGYYGLDVDPLERWADKVPQDWFNPSNSGEN
jgi:hypothetical protein